MAQVRVRKRGKMFSYIFEAGKIDGNMTLRTLERANHAEFVHAQHAEITGRNGGDFR